MALLTDADVFGPGPAAGSLLTDDDVFGPPGAAEIDTGASLTAARAAASPREVSWGEVVTGVADTMGPMMRRQVAGLMQFGATGEMTVGERADVMGSRYFGDAKGTTEQETQATIDARRAEVRQSAARTAEEAAREMAAARPDIDPNSVKGFAFDFAVSMANMAPAVAATVATRQPGVGMSMIGGQVFGDQYAESREKGRSHNEAIQDGVFMAAAEAIPEAIPLGILARPGVSMVSRFFKGTVAEGVQEMFTQALQDGYDAGVLEEDMTWGQAMENMARAGLLGSAMGGSFAVATEPFVRGRRGQEGPGEPAGPDGGLVTDADAMGPTQPEETGSATPTPPSAPPRRMAPVTPEDAASPIATDRISRGKAMLDDAVAGRPLDIERPAPTEQAVESGQTTEPAVETVPTQQAADAVGAADAVAPPGPEWRPLYSDTSRSEQVGWVNPQTGEEVARDTTPVQAPEAPALPGAVRQQQDVPVTVETLTDQDVGLDGEQASTPSPALPEESNLQKAQNAAAPTAQANSAAEIGDAMGRMGAGIADGMYNMLWRKVEAGDTTENGVQSPLLQVAKAIRDQGGRISRDTLPALGNEYARIEGTAAGAERQAQLRSLVGRWVNQTAAPTQRQSAPRADAQPSAARVAQDAAQTDTAPTEAPAPARASVAQRVAIEGQRPTLIGQRVRTAGPASVRLTPLDATPEFYHETNGQGLASIIDSSYANNADGSFTQIFVTDDRDLAIGQGKNRGGVMVQFRGDALSGRENRKPGTGIVGGREFQTDWMAPDAVDRVFVPEGTKLGGVTRSFLNRFFERQPAPGGTEYIRRIGVDGDQTKPAGRIRARPAAVAAPPAARPGGARREFDRRYRVPRRPASLTDFVRDRGGIRANDQNIGDIRSIADKGAFRLLARGGMPLDQMRIRAAEAGYLPADSTTADFLALLDQDIAAAGDAQMQRVYSQSDGAAVAEFQQAERTRAEAEREFADVDLGRFPSLDVAEEYLRSAGDLRTAIDEAERRLDDIDAEIDRLERLAIQSEADYVGRDDTDVADIPFDYVSPGESTGGTVAARQPEGAARGGDVADGAEASRPRDRAGRDRAEGAAGDRPGVNEPGLRDEGPPAGSTSDPDGYTDLRSELDIEGSRDDRIDQVDDWVSAKDAATTKEHVAVLDAEGNLLQAGTVGAEGEVRLSDEVTALLDDSGAGLYITHNHPRGTSLSPQDVMVLAQPGVESLRVITYEGRFTAEMTPEAKAAIGSPETFRQIVNRVDRLLRRRVRAAVNDGRVTADEANFRFAHARNLLLHRLGVTKYRTSLPADALSPEMQAVIERTVRVGRTGLGPLKKQKEQDLGQVYDRLSEPVRSGERVGRVRARDEDAAAGSGRGSGRAGGGGRIPPGREDARDATVSSARAGRVLEEDRRPLGNPQTETAAFKRWFRDSKVVDENGEPLRVYHGTNGDIEAFDAGRGGSTTGAEDARHGFFFSSNPDVAASYTEYYDPYIDLFGDNWASRTYARMNEAFMRMVGGPSAYTAGGNVMPIYLSIQNPFVVETRGREYDPRAFMDAIRAAKDAGHDGVVFRGARDSFDGDGSASDVYVPFRPEQIKSATGNRGAFDPTDPNILREESAKFDLPAAERKVARRLSASDRALIDRHLAPAGGGLISRLAKASFIRDIARDGWADTLVTNIVTSLNPIFAYEKRAEALTGGMPRVRDASVSAAKMAEFTMNDTGRTWAMFHVGPMRYDAGQGIVVADESVPGLYDIFKYLSDPETYDQFRLYAAARRAERLAAEGRENNMTDAAIARGLDLADETGRYRGETRTFRAVFDDYQRFNKALLEGMGRDTGMMSQEDIDFYTEHMDYVPFYREAEDTGTVPTGAYLRKNINKPDAGIKKLVGGEQRIADLMENIVRNAEAITRAGMRNVTMRRIFEIAEVLGEGQIVREGSTDDGVLTYRVNGREVKFTVDDPSLVAAVASMRPEQHTGLYKALVSITGFFRAGITAMPSFMLRNLVRGTTAGFVQTGKNISLQHNVATGLKRAWRNDRSIRELKAITGTGSYTFGGPSGNAAALLRRSTGAQRDFLPISVVKSVWGALERAGEATELADRDAIYNNLIREGATKAEAAYQAMNLINYSRKGSSRSLRALLPLVPFLNARIQGLYRMGETQTGGVDRRKILAGVAVRGLVLTAVSVALREATKDDDRYDDEPLHRKLNYYILYAGDTRILIPKAFEFGAIFSTLPELTLDAIEQKEGKRLAEGLAQTLLTTFAFNPIPQPALPMIENIANYNFFTGREIENQRLKNLPAGQRYTAATPQVLREIGKAADISPAQMENLIRGYTGSMGMSLLAGLDSIGRAVGVFPSEPTGPFGDYGIFSDALQDQIGSMYKVGPDRSNRWIGDLYELSRDINQTYRQVESLVEEGEMEAARKAAEDGRIEWRTFVNRQVRALSSINAQVRMIEEDPSLSGAYKRTELNKLYEIRNRIAEMTVKEATGRN